MFCFHVFIHFFLSVYHPQCPVARSCIVELHAVWRLNSFSFANLVTQLLSYYPGHHTCLSPCSSLPFQIAYSYGMQAPCRSPWDAIHDLPSLRWLLHLPLFLPVRFYSILHKKMPITVIQRADDTVNSRELTEGCVGRGQKSRFHPLRLDVAKDIFSQA